MKKNELIINQEISKMNNEAIQMEVAERNENKKISKRIKLLRKEKGMTQVELAEDLGIPCKTLINWEVGERKPNYENMLLLAKYFNVSCAYIRCETDERQYDSENALTSKQTLDNEEIDLLYNLVFKEIMWAERLAENFDLNSKENVDTKACLVKLAAKLMCMKN